MPGLWFTIGCIAGAWIGAAIGIFMIIMVQGGAEGDAAMHRFQERENKKHDWRDNE